MQFVLEIRDFWGNFRQNSREPREFFWEGRGNFGWEIPEKIPNFLQVLHSAVQGGLTKIIQNQNIVKKNEVFTQLLRY